MISVSGTLTETEFTRNVHAARAMAAMCILTGELKSRRYCTRLYLGTNCLLDLVFAGVLYLVDTISSCFFRSKIHKYENP